MEKKIHFFILGDFTDIRQESKKEFTLARSWKDRKRMQKDYRVVQKSERLARER